MKLKLVSCHLVGREALLIQRDDDARELVATIFFDRDQLMSAILQSPEDVHAPKILKNLEESFLPEFAECEPVSFRGWAANFLSIAICMKDEESTWKIGEAYSNEWAIAALINDSDMVSDHDLDEKMLLFISTPDNTHHVFLVFSQKQAAAAILGVGGKRPEDLTDALLYLPIEHATKNPVALTGQMARMLFFSSISVNRFLEETSDQIASGTIGENILHS